MQQIGRGRDVDHHVDVNGHCIVASEGENNQHICPIAACTFPFRSSTTALSSHYSEVQPPSLLPSNQHLYSPTPIHAMRDPMALSNHRKSIVQVVVYQVSTKCGQHFSLASSDRCRSHSFSSTQPSQKHSSQKPTHMHRDQNVPV